MKKRLMLVAAALALVGCALLERIPCVGLGCAPIPAPSPVEASPEPEPTPKPIPSVLPPASPEPEPTPKPSPIPTIAPPASPEPCVAKPQCVTKDGSPARDCISCAQFIAERNFQREGDLVFFIGSEGKEYIDPRTCFVVYGPGDTRTRTKRYHNDGTVCGTPEGCSANPKPCAPTPAPASPAPNGSPTPQATPATCPPLMRVGGGLFNCQRKGIPKACPTDKNPGATLEAGDRVTLDTTHHFGRRTASACDEPWDKPCGGRICDDQANGTKFFLERAPGPCWKTGTHQLTCAPLASGRYRIRLAPADDYRDTLGQRVDVSQAEGDVIEFDVQ